MKDCLFLMAIFSVLNPAFPSYKFSTSLRGGMSLEPVVFVAIVGGLILMLLIIGAPLRPVRFIGQGIIKVIIGAAFLFFLNTLGNQAGIHVPSTLLPRQSPACLEYRELPHWRPLVIGSFKG